MTSELDKAAEEYWLKVYKSAISAIMPARDLISDAYFAGHARGVADERERAEGLVRALRHSLSWGESMYGRLVAGHKDDINWTAIEEARRTLAEYEDRNARP